ncbi:hypothetical protein PtA15_5A82 [Puccinia triticina]|uniref:Dynein heavy chain linker domain-containing protein n=1 Tax=Puccinia triticina TaxID=208348 RepID=A0ABY7CKK6_9BASI|nr:uncharacterized protein PtA15_5A82 [Puccinia triticina]WAQ84512.1 hypothetical protein PtA15_5A82 [Puccinia triticina]
MNLWEDQVRVGLEQEDIKEASKKLLAEFFENEEVISSLKHRLLHGELPATLAKLDEVLDGIAKREEAQRKLALSLGKDYNELSPWALDPLVRKGIKSVLFLDRVEEEIALLTQELDRMISWATDYWNLVMSTLASIESEYEEPLDLNNRFAAILPTFPMKAKLRMLHSELKSHLHKHKKLMVSWMPDVETLWIKTRTRHTKANHTWFESIGSIKDQLTRENLGGINDALENLTFQENEVDPEGAEDRENEIEEGEENEIKERREDVDNGENGSGQENVENADNGPDEAA